MHIFRPHSIDIWHGHIHACAILMHLCHAACRSKLIIDSKADESPVTKADREAEAAMRRLLAERVPDHAIFGAKCQQIPLLLCTHDAIFAYWPAGNM